MCYDVPVKLYSFHLLVMALVLTLPDLRGLINFFLLRRSAQAHTPALPPPARRSLRYVTWTLQALLIASVIYPDVTGAIITDRQARNNAMDRSGDHGIWDVDSFLIDGKEASPTDPRRWRQLVIEYAAWWPVSFSDASKPDSAFQIKAAQQNKVELHDALHNAPTNAPATLTWQQPDPRHLIFTGVIGASPAVIHLSRYDEKQFLLTNRGFHWVSEYPFNR